MDIEPASVDQVRQASDGRYVEISADAGGVVDSLKRIDKGFGVRFAEFGNPPFWAVYHTEGRTARLVLTAKAYQSDTGIWTGLDQRVVRRVMEIGDSSYDYATELQRQDERARKNRRDAFREKAGELGERAAHAVRKDLNVKNRAFKPRDV